MQIEDNKELWEQLQVLMIETTDNWFSKNWRGLIGIGSRTGIFTAAVTVWLMIVQRLTPGQTLVTAVRQLQRGKADLLLARNLGSKRVKEGRISGSTGGFSRARQRLPLEFVSGVAEGLTKRLINNQTVERWHGQQVYVLDGTIITLADEDELHEVFGGNRSHRQLHHPQMRVVLAHELASGVALRPEFGAVSGSKAASEQSLSHALIERLPQGAIAIADRNFGVFSVVYAAHKRGVDVLVRLLGARANKFRGPGKKRSNDHQVEWKPSAVDLKTNPDIPADVIVKGRFVRVVVRRTGFRPLELLFFTTLSQSPEELAELYKQRERIETDIRSIKRTINMEMLYSKTPDMVAKEIILGVCAYSLIRAIVQRCAPEIGLHPRQVSFTNAAEQILIIGESMWLSRSRAQRDNWKPAFLQALYQLKLPTRSRQRHEPRKLTRRKSNYAVMTLPRNEERQKSIKLSK